MRRRPSSVCRPLSPGAVNRGRRFWRERRGDHDPGSMVVAHGLSGTTGTTRPSPRQGSRSVAWRRREAGSTEARARSTRCFIRVAIGVASTGGEHWGIRAGGTATCSPCSSVRSGMTVAPPSTAVATALSRSAAVAILMRVITRFSRRQRRRVSTSTLEYDFNVPEPTGVAGFYQRNILNGRRQSAAAAFLQPSMSRPNVEVRSRARVTRLLIDGRRAVGVEYVHEGSTEPMRVASGA